MPPCLNSNYQFYVPESKKVQLPEHYSSFGVRFASLNYQLQHRVHYLYKLDGHDTEWTNAGKDRMATYTDLPAGTYTLRIRAFLLESPDKYDERTIEIEVPHNFFFSSRAIWLYLLLIIAASITLMYFRIETIDSFFQSVLRNLARELDLTANAAGLRYIPRSRSRWRP